MTSYVIRDHLDPAYVDETIHLSLYNVTERNNKKPGSHSLLVLPCAWLSIVVAQSRGNYIATSFARVTALSWRSLMLWNPW